MAEKLFSTEIVAGYPLFFKFSFNHSLGRYTGMIGPWKPQGLMTRHSIVTNKNILQRVIQNMTERKTSGNIGRRHQNGIWSFAALQNTGAFGMETAYRLPVRTSPTVFYIVMVIGFFQIE